MRSVVQPSKWTFGVKEEEMSDKEWFNSGMSTFASVMYEDEDGDLVTLNTVKNIATKTYGKEHAEDVAIRALLESFEENDLNGMPVVLNLSKSPCSSKYGTSNKTVGCAEELVKFVNKYGVKLTITFRGLYKGLEGSKLAVEWMRSKGITLSGDVRVGRQKRFGEDDDL